MQQQAAEQVVAALQQRRIFAHVYSGGVGSHGVRIVLVGGREALWDVDGAAGLEAQVMMDGVLVGFVPKIPGSESFSIDETIEAIASATYE
ncbi:MAG: hypothetical protein WCI29_11575 [Actinomycetes bacterium]